MTEFLLFAILAFSPIIGIGEHQKATVHGGGCAFIDNYNTIQQCEQNQDLDNETAITPELSQAETMGILELTEEEREHFRKAQWK